VSYHQTEAGGGPFRLLGAYARGAGTGHSHRRGRGHHGLLVVVVVVDRLHLDQAGLVRLCLRQLGTKRTGTSLGGRKLSAELLDLGDEITWSIGALGAETRVLLLKFGDTTALVER
jgi:hypothetical protein